jgi:hypothetical protein
MALLERQHFRCALSGRALTPATAALDHIVPIRAGGEHIIENVQVLDKDVNRAKNALTSAEFIELCLDVVRWWEGGSPITPARPKSPERPPSRRVAPASAGGTAGVKGRGSARNATWANVGRPLANGRAP